MGKEEKKRKRRRKNRLPLFFVTGVINLSESSIFTEMFKSSPYLARMSLQLFYTYFTLGSRVRKTRRAFEEELVLSGMSRVDAKRISACYEELKNSITSMLKKGVARSIEQR